MKGLLKKLISPPPEVKGGVVLTVLIGWGVLAFSDGLARLSYDLLFQWHVEKPKEDIALVYFDREVKQKLNLDPELPLPYSHHARVLQNLTAGGARLVLFDIIFSTNEPGISEFADAIRTNKNVVLAAYSSNRLRPIYNVDIVNEVFDPPPAVLLNSGAAWGLARIATPDPDRGIRRLDTGDRSVPSLSWRSAQILGYDITDENKFPRARIQIQRKWLNWICAPHELPRYEYDEIYHNALTTNPFGGKIVIVCARPSVDVADAGRDEFATPFSRFGKPFAPGGQIHALSLLNLRHQDWLTRPLPYVETFILLLSGLGFGWLLSTSRPRRATLIALSGIAAVFLFSILLLYVTKHWFAWIDIAGAQIPAALIWGISAHAFRQEKARLKAQIAQAEAETKKAQAEQQAAEAESARARAEAETSEAEKKKAEAEKVAAIAEKQVAVLRDSLSHYFSPARVRQILANPEKVMNREPEKRDVTMLFTDLADFSGESLKMFPKGVFDALNTYFKQALPCVFNEEGTVMDLIGDAIFAIWNAPEDQPDHIERAVRAALALRSQVLEIEAKEDVAPLFKTRIGLHSDQVVIGNVGSDERFDYSAVGKNVNLSSRLEGANKYLGTQVLGTYPIIDKIRGKIGFRFAGLYIFQGFREPVQVYEILDAEKETEKWGWLKLYKRGTQLFNEKKFAEAETEFRSVLQERPDDELTKRFLERVAELKGLPKLDRDWDIFVLEKK